MKCWHNKVVFSGFVYSATYKHKYTKNAEMEEMNPNVDNQLMFFAARQIKLRCFYTNKINVFILLVYSFSLQQNKPFSDAQVIRTRCIA